MSGGSLGRIALALALICSFSAAAVAAERETTAWDGVWWQIWGEFTPMKVVVRDGRVVDCLYKGRPQPTANFRILSLSPARLSFGDPPDFVATLTMTGENRASGHFHGPAGESDAAMERESR
jgi:hypothetical protein